MVIGLGLAGARLLTYVPPMIGDPLSVEVRSRSITVTMPGTNYAVTYQKHSAGPDLVLTHNWTLVQKTTPAISDFRSRAFLAASAKARELGWIA